MNKFYFPVSTSSEVRQRILSGEMPLEKRIGKIEHAKIDNTPSMPPVFYPDTPIGLNLTIRLRSRLVCSLGFSEPEEVQEIALAYGIPVPSLDARVYVTHIGELKGKKIIVHMGERSSTDEQFEGVHVPCVYAVSLPS